MIIDKPKGDVCIIGAGFVGCAAALGLNRLGFSIDLVDMRQKTLFGKGDSRAIVLSHTSKELLQLVGLWQRIEKQSQAIREIRVSEAGVFGVVSLKAEDAGLEALGWSCDASVLLAELQDLLLKSDTIRIHWNAKVEEFQHEKGWTIYYYKKNKKIKIRSDLLLASDGSESDVKKCLQMKADTIDYDQSAVISTVETQGSSSDIAYLRFLPKGSLALIPNRAGKFVSIHCLGKEQADRVRRYDDHHFLHFIEKNFGRRLGDFVSCSERKCHPIARSSLEEVTGNRCLFLGNAANTLHPVAAQGLNLGFRDVLALQAALISTPDDLDEALAEYRSRVEPDHLGTTLYSDLLVQSFSSELALLKIGRRVFMRFLDQVSPLKRKFILRGTGLATSAARN